MGSITLRVRSLVWFVTGAVLAAGVTVMFMSAWRVDAAPGDADATFVAITPCRLADTRPAPTRVGPAGTIGAAATQTFAVHGTNGECTIPADAVAVGLNVTALGASDQSFLTFWPDGSQPLAASLNPAPGEPPTPNAVTVDLSDVGAFNVYNDKGTVNVVIDINGYFTASSLKELASRLAAVESAQAAGVDPAVLARIGAVETIAATNTSDIATNTSGIATNTTNIGALDDAQPFAVFSDPASAVSVGSDWTEIRKVTLTAPVNGQVSVVSSAGLNEFVDGQIVRCGIGETVDDPGSAHRRDWQSPTVGSYGIMSATRGYDVAAGATVTYYLVCRNTTPSGGSAAAAPYMAAIFTPAT